jgi:hypothetical protein
MMGASTNMAIRLVASFEADPQKGGRFTGHLESTGQLLVATGTIAASTGGKSARLHSARCRSARGLCCWT